MEMGDHRAAEPISLVKATEPLLPSQECLFQMKAPFRLQPERLLHPADPIFLQPTLQMVVRSGWVDEIRSTG